MRTFLALLFLACCGQTTSDVDAGGDAQKPACFTDLRTTATRTCQTNADCAVVDHYADCCQSIVENGVRGDQVNAIHDAENTEDQGCLNCGCPAAPTVDELGNGGQAFVASCDNGLCTAHAQ